MRFLSLFCVLIYSVTDACLLLLCLILFFSTKLRDTKKNVSKMTLFCV